jgi:hypothetical protein
MQAVAATAVGGCSLGSTGNDPEQAAEQSISVGLCDWPQAFGTPDHAGRACPEVHGLTKVAEIVQDADWEAEVQSNGFLQVHEGPAVTWGDMLVVPVKSRFTDVDNQQTVQYGVAAYRWTPSIMAPDRVLEHVWDGDTDFVTVDGAVCSFGCMTNGNVQEHAIAIAHGSVYSPAAHGQFVRWSLASGKILSRIDPFVGTPIGGDARLTVDNAPMVDAAGNVYYTATAWPLGPTPFGAQPRGSWLVKLFPDDTFRVVDWTPDNVIKLGGTPIANPSVGVPLFADATCEIAFGSRGTPRASGPDSKPQLGLCATQRPALNAPVAYSAATNHLYLYSYSNNSRAVAFIIEVDADTLLPIRAADLRDNDLEYACGVRLNVATFPGCDVITAGGTRNIGNDPDFNGRVHLRTPADIMDNAVSVSPDGRLWTLGSYDGGFAFEPVGGYDAQSASIMFGADGRFLASNSEFNWEVTTSWKPIFGFHATTPSPVVTGYQIYQDRGLYNLGHLGVATYDDRYHLLSVGEAPDQLFGDFVDTNIPFGPAGDHYGVTEFGVLYKLDDRSQIVETLQILDEPIEVLSGQISRDRMGDLIVSNAGRIHVIASSQTRSRTMSLAVAAPSPSVVTRMAAGRAAKARAARGLEPPLRMAP